ncbi:uncharacterized protein [Haliotis cracherodii]|uniref:uncharacterized protein n=1 Tax=Haliotis cracherodii TaxID=6455 RepID=UPI0039EBCA36
MTKLTSDGFGTCAKRAEPLTEYEGNFSNHSGKGTCATRLCEAGIEEQEIVWITCQDSLDAVQKYKRPSPSMLADISDKLDPPKEISVEWSVPAECVEMFQSSSHLQWVVG